MSRQFKRLLHRRSERGTVLVIVLGALALISVITVVYVTVGQTDRRSAAVAVRKDTVDSTVVAIKDYIAQTIADEAVAVRVDGYTLDTSGASPVLVPRLIRSATTFPFVDPIRRSTLAQPGQPVSAANRVRRFDPTGSYSDVFRLPTGTATYDPRLPGTPFLAATTPSWLRAGLLTNQDPARAYLFSRDWLQISNIAPDGRFVNLWNLAPVVDQSGTFVRVSGFEASSPIPVDNTLLTDFNAMRPQVLTGGRVQSHLSFGLTLADPSTARAPVNGDPGRGDILPSVDNTYAPVPVARYEPGVSPSVTLAADPNIPAHWTRYQLNMVRPMRDNQFGPDRPEYLPYQWGDTDGDGFPDARWFELVDASDPANIRSILPRDDRFRWFAAVRVVDLNGLVDVNTATEFRRPPRPVTPVQAGEPPWSVTQSTKAGQSPADIDLRRLLTQDDIYTTFADATASGPAAGVAQFHQPLAAANDRASDYSALTRAQARTMGERAFNALLLARRLSRSFEVPSPGADVSTGVAPLAADQRWLSYTRRPAPGGTFAGQPFVGRGAAGTSVPAGSTTTIISGGGFGVADQIELMTFRTQNDPSVTSPLERLLDGRDITSGDTQARGPMRSGRSAAYESAVDVDGAGGLGNGRIDAEALARNTFDIRQYLTAFSGTRLLRAGPVPAEAQGRLDASLDAKIDAYDALNMIARAWWLGRTPLPATGSQEANRLVASWDLLFKGYADALLPYSDEPGAWGIEYPFPTTVLDSNALAFNPANPAERVRTATLHYGGNRGPFTRWGPELALRLAAHMTANAAAAFDFNDPAGLDAVPQVRFDDAPRPFTLLIDRRVAPAVYSNTPVPGIVTADQARFMYPWAKTAHPTQTQPASSPTPVVRPGLLDLDRDLGINTQRNRLASTDPAITPADEPTTARAGAITVFGIKAQPFITNVTTMVIYADSDTSDNTPTDVVINTEIAGSSGSASPDVVAQIIAFQLHNPFDLPVYLTRKPPRPASSATPLPPDAWSDFYIEYNEFLFKFVGVDSAGAAIDLSLAPGETRVFYALNRPLADVESALTAGGVTGATPIDTLVNAQFANTGDPATGIQALPQRIQLMEGLASAAATQWSASTLSIGSGDAVDFLDDVTPNPVLYPTGATPTSTELKRQVRLWRALGTPASTGPAAGLFDAAANGDLSRTGNLRYNDQLVDVMSDVDLTVAATLDCRVVAGATVTLPASGFDPTTSNAAFITRATLTRRSDPVSTTGSQAFRNVARGYLFTNKSGWFGPPLALAFREPGGSAPLSAGDVSLATTGYARDSLSGLFSVLTDTTADLKLTQSRTRAEQRTAGAITANLDTRTIAQLRAEFSRIRFGGITFAPAGAANADFARDFGGAPLADAPAGGLPNTRASSARIPTLRVADLVNVLAIGPEYDPSNTPVGIGSAPGGDTRPDVNGFITLSQALALAANYISPPDAPASPPASLVLPQPPNHTVYARLGAFNSPAGPDAPAVGALDRGYLMLDRYAPFEDRAAAPVTFGATTEIVGIFNANATGTIQDVKRWPGIPLALNIFNVFDTRAAKENAITTPVPGLINLNTAPLAVLRLIPMFSPTTEPGVWQGTATNLLPAWPATANKSFLSLALGANTTASAAVPLPTVDSDIAPALVAYRDRAIGFNRGVQSTLAAGTAPTPQRLVFVDTQQTTVPTLTAQFTAPINYEGPAGWDGRFLTTGLPAGREAPGLATPGELLMLINRQLRAGSFPAASPPITFSVTNPLGTAPTPAVVAGLRLPAASQIDDQGLQAARTAVTAGPAQLSGSPGVSLNTVFATPSIETQIVEPDSWTERLMVAAAAAQTTTTRSDVFGVWFIVHGYTRADTENLRLNDPLTPSVARRFVMVVDRSNVTQKGQKPRIVLFQEVPMTQK